MLCWHGSVASLWTVVFKVLDNKLEDAMVYVRGPSTVTQYDAAQELADPPDAVDTRGQGFFVELKAILNCIVL